MHFNDFLYYSVKFSFYGREHDVVHILAHHRPVGRNFHYRKIVYRFKLVFLCFCGTCHTCELFVHAEEVLECDSRKSLRLRRYAHVLLRLNSLVQTVGIPSARHQSARKLVYNDYFAVLYYIIYITLNYISGFERLINMVVKVCMFYIGEVFYIEKLFSLCRTLFREVRRFSLFVYDIVLFFFQPACKAVSDLVKICTFIPCAGNNERSTRFVD